MTKTQKLASQINAAMRDRHPSEYRAMAESLAANIGVGLYWLGTASNHDGLPTAQVFQVGARGQWSRQLGTITQDHEGRFAA